MEKIYLQVYHHSLSSIEEDNWIDINSLEVHPEIVQRLVEWGILEIRHGQIEARQVKRLQKIMRIRRNLGVNLSGASIILDLLDKIEMLQEEIEKLKRR